MEKKSTKKSKSKGLLSLFNIEKSMEYRKTIKNLMEEIMKIKSSNKCERRKIEDYKEETLKFLNLLTIKDRYQLIGSHIFKDHKYPIDIDISEFLYVDIDKVKKKNNKECFWLADKITNLIVKLQLKYPDIIFLEFKVGNNYSYHIDLGEVDYKKKKIKNFDSLKVEKHINKLYKNKKLTRKEKIYLIDLVSGEISITKWKLLSSFFRSKYLLRWSMDEMLSQKKISDDGKIIHLQDTFGDDTIIKLDALCYIENRYKEVTNVFLLIDKNKKKEKQIEKFNLKKDFYIYQDIFKYLMEKNNLKLLKRLWSLSCSQNIKKNIKILAPIFQSSISALGQIQGEIDNLGVILEFIENNLLSKKKLDYTFLYKNKFYLELLTKRFIIHLLDIQNRLYNLLDDNYNDIVTSKISEFFYNNSDKFWHTIENGLNLKQIKQLKIIFEDISGFIKRFLNDSINQYLKYKKTTINELIKEVKNTY